MTSGTGRAARYQVSYGLRYHVFEERRMDAPKAPPVSAVGDTSCEETRPARVTVRRRRVPPAGVKTGVAGEGGATPADRSRSPLTRRVSPAASAARD